MVYAFLFLKLKEMMNLKYVIIGVYIRKLDKKEFWKVSQKKFEEIKNDSSIHIFAIQSIGEDNDQID